jgi:hypothetical protein
LLFNVKWTHFQLYHGEFSCSTFTYIFVIAHLLKQFSTYIKLMYFDKNECIQNRVFHKDVKKKAINTLNVNIYIGKINISGVNFRVIN